MSNTRPYTITSVTCKINYFNFRCRPKPKYVPGSNVNFVDVAVSIFGNRLISVISFHHFSVLPWRTKNFVLKWVLYNRHTTTFIRRIPEEPCVKWRLFFPNQTARYVERSRRGALNKKKLITLENISSYFVTFLKSNHALGLILLSPKKQMTRSGLFFCKTDFYSTTRKDVSTSN